MKAWEMQPDGVHPIIRFGDNPSLDNPATAKQVEEFVAQKKGQPSKPDATEMVDSWIPLPDGSENKWPCRMLLRNESGGWKLSHLYFFGGPNIGADAWADRSVKAGEAAGLFGKKQPFPDWIPHSQPRPQPPPSPSRSATSTTPPKRKEKEGVSKVEHANAGISHIIIYCAIAAISFGIIVAMIGFAGKGSGSANPPQNPSPAPAPATVSSNEPSTWPSPGQGQVSPSNPSSNIPQPLASPRPSTQAGGAEAAGGKSIPDTTGIDAQNNATTVEIRNRACTPPNLKSWAPRGGPLFIGFCQCTRQTIGTETTPGAPSCTFMVRNDDVVSHPFAIEEPVSVTDDLGYHSNQRTGDVRCGHDGQSFTLSPGIPVTCTLTFQDGSGGANRFANVALSVLWDGSSGPYPPINRVPISDSH